MRGLWQRKPRELHLELKQELATLICLGEQMEANNKLVEAGYFTTVELKTRKPFYTTGSSFSFWTCEDIFDQSLASSKYYTVLWNIDDSETSQGSKFFFYAWYTIPPTTSHWWCILACRGPSTNNRILTCIIHPSFICSGSNTCGNSTFTNWTSTKKAFQHNCPLYPSISVLLRVALELVQ